MSSIKKLSIQGIRSFGHKDGDRQEIEFFRPLTLITGCNGAGKTSVIECLRYMTTGDSPPLTRTNISAFIHDPKVAQTKVKAKVELKFKDMYGNEAVAKRDRSVNVKEDAKNGIQCDREVCEISYQKIHEGKIIDVCLHRSNELKEMMITLLGVSKPILDNVVFCHQEDSNWPLGGAKDLKEKFDNIFAASRYMKALDNIEKIRKEKNNDVEKYKLEIGHLENNKEKAKQVDAEYQNKKKELSKAKDSVKRMNDELRAINKPLQETSRKLDKADKLKQKIEKLKVEKIGKEENLKEFGKRPKTIFEDEELLRKEKEHRERKTEKQKPKEVYLQLQAEKGEIEKSLENLVGELSSLSQQSESRGQTVRMQQEKNRKLNNIRDIRSKYEDQAKQLMGRFPRSKEVLEKFTMDLHLKVRTQQEMLESKKQDLSKREAEEKMHVKRLKILELDLSSSRKAVLKVCGKGDDLNELVKRQQEVVQDIEREKGTLAGIYQLFKDYIQKLGQDAACPLCHRGFDSTRQVEQLTQELKKKLSLTPIQLKERAKFEKTLLNEMIHLKPTYELISKLSNTDIPDVKAELTKIRTSIKDCEQSITGYESTLKDLQDKDVAMRGMYSEIMQMYSHEKEVDEWDQEIASQSQHLPETDRNSEQVTAERGKLQQKLMQVNSKLDKICSIIKDDSNLEYNHQLRQKRKNIEKVTEEITSLEEQLAEYGRDALEEENRQLIQQYNRLRDIKCNVEGSIPNLEKDVEKLRKECDEDMYKNADSKYQDMKLKLVTTSIATEDLKKYWQALDRAIMTYHKWKMAGVNKKVRELWQDTYKGNDIDYIEIQSEGKTGDGEKKRKYDYKVVMFRNGVPLKMRGRCSAGQKVLASLIIRLALAETFCFNCGLLALDEPTANLDEDNIASLAEALEDIIKSREDQRNFQLIVITHNEGFARSLGSGSADFFYRVSKNKEGKSIVKRHNIQTGDKVLNAPDSDAASSSSHHCNASPQNQAKPRKVAKVIGSSGKWLSKNQKGTTHQVLPTTDSHSNVASTSGHCPNAATLQNQVKSRTLAQVSPPNSASQMGKVMETGSDADVASTSGQWHIAPSLQDQARQMETTQQVSLGSPAMSHTSSDADLYVAAVSHSDSDSDSDVTDFSDSESKSMSKPVTAVQYDPDSIIVISSDDDEA